MQGIFAGLAMAAPPARAPFRARADKSSTGREGPSQPMVWTRRVWEAPRRRRPGWTFLVATCILAAQPAAGRAQSPGPAAGRTDRSTQQGIFTREQALRGKDTFLGSCTGCHTPASHTGTTFTTGWVGKSVWELFRYVSENMPKNDPGILTAREYADLSAYLLMLNGMPAGSTELPAEQAALEKIRIDTASAARAGSMRNDP